MSHPIARRLALSTALLAAFGSLSLHAVAQEKIKVGLMLPYTGTFAALGDSFTEGEDLKFTGIPSFAAEHFRRVRLKNPLKSKQLEKGLVQLAEEGAIQVFRPLLGNDYIVGAVGVLQFDVTMDRLRTEYGVDAIYEGVDYATARWVGCADARKLAEFERKNQQVGKK